MPRTISSVAIFLASPTDVDHERELVARTIQEWNDIHSRHREIYFELLRYERSVSAGFGEDGQDVINTQIDDEYDVLIALFWKRLGTATPRARSGTVEEYERALERFRSGEKVSLAFFFKDAPIDFRREDIAQLSAVQDFEIEVQKAGALTKTFRDDEALRFELNLLLDRISRENSPDGGARGENSDRNEIQKSGNTKVSNSDNLTISEELIDPIDEDDEIGLLDVTEDLLQHTNAATAFLNEMSTELNIMSSITNGVSAEMEEITKLRALTTQETRPLVSKISSSMDKFSDFLERMFPEYSENTSLMVNDIRKLVDISYDFLNENNEQFISDVNGFRQIVIQTQESMRDSRKAFAGMQTSIQGLQRMTSAFNKSRKRLVNNNDLLLRKMDSDVVLLGQAIEELDRLLEVAEESKSSSG